jgi:hypothetical protein
MVGPVSVETWSSGAKIADDGIGWANNWTVEHCRE